MGTIHHDQSPVAAAATQATSEPSDDTTITISNHFGTFCTNESCLPPTIGAPIAGYGAPR